MSKLKKSKLLGYHAKCSCCGFDTREKDEHGFERDLASVEMIYCVNRCKNKKGEYILLEKEEVLDTKKYKLKKWWKEFLEAIQDRGFWVAIFMP